MPIDDKTGGKVRYIQNKDAICMTENQASYVYKKVEQGSIINTETMKQETEQKKLTETDREDDKGDIKQNLQGWRQNDANGKFVNS